MTGILPYSQSTFYGKGSKAWKTDFPADFSLVGSGVSYPDCGQIFATGCLEIEKHNGITLEGVDFTGKAVVKYVKNSCHRPLCPECWGDWANRECDNANKRLDSYVLKLGSGKRLKPIHVIVSVPHVDYGLSLPKMRQKVYRALKRVGLLGGMSIYHPKRKNKRKEWYFSPHFHMIGYGWIRDTRKNYVHSGYVVKNVGVRKNVRGTIFYQLSHCGVPENHRHVVTWFGALAYNKLKVGKIVKEKNVCPLCGSRLRRLVWIGEESNILGLMHKKVESGFYFENGDFWRYKQKNVVCSLPEGCEILSGAY